VPRGEPAPEVLLNSVGTNVALGNAAWGLVASVVGVRLALVAAAVCLFVFDLTTAFWRIAGDAMTNAEVVISPGRPAA
jgi:hypothetical protein